MKNGFISLHTLDKKSNYRLLRKVFDCDKDFKHSSFFQNLLKKDFIFLLLLRIIKFAQNQKAEELLKLSKEINRLPIDYNELFSWNYQAQVYLQSLIHSLKSLDQPVFVTRPDLPALEDCIPMFENIWENRVLTNHGPYCQEFESCLSKFLLAKNLSVVNNATTGLMLALKALAKGSEIITTPFTFAATASSIKWLGLKLFL